jgi:hypothetical protein
VCDIAISTAAFCLWDIGPERKLNICRELGFNRIVIAFSTLKMLRQFASSPKLCEKLTQFTNVMIHAPWCGINYKNNKATKDVFAHIDLIVQKVKIDAVIFHFDCIKDWSQFRDCSFPYYIKNPNNSSWQTFDNALNQHGFDSVLDINRSIRFEKYIDKYLDHHKEQIKAVHVSGFIDELGRTPIVESGQMELLNKVKQVDAPIIIEGLFSPGDFQGIREEIKVIQDSVYG